MSAFLVALGGALGAVLRYLVDRWVQRRRDSPFPWGTLTVNVAGSALLGFLTGWALTGAQPDSVRTFAGIGLCGSLTTFSTFGYETLRLFGERARRYALANVAGTVLAGFTAAAVGLLISTAIWR